MVVARRPLETAEGVLKIAPPLSENYAELYTLIVRSHEMLNVGLMHIQYTITRAKLNNHRCRCCCCSFSILTMTSPLNVPSQPIPGSSPFPYPFPSPFTSLSNPLPPPGTTTTTSTSPFVSFPPSGLTPNFPHTLSNLGGPTLPRPNTLKDNGAGAGVGVGGGAGIGVVGDGEVEMDDVVRGCEEAFRVLERLEMVLGEIKRMQSGVFERGRPEGVQVGPDGLSKLECRSTHHFPTSDLFQPETLVYLYRNTDDSYSSSFRM